MSEKLYGFTPEEVDLIRKTVGKEAVSEAEFQRFLYRANKLGLNPLDGTIHLLARNRKKPDGSWEKTNIVLLGIDGFRAVADNTGKLAGIKRDVILNEKGHLVGAWAEVYRSDWGQPAREVISFDEYCQFGRDGKPTGLWATMPKTMCKKCAEAAAHRMAFPSALAGIYIPEEIKPDDEEAEPGRKARTKGEGKKTETNGASVGPAVPADEPEEKPAGQPAEKPAGDSPEKPAGKPEEKPVNEPAEKPAEKPQERPANEPAEKPAGKPEKPPVTDYTGEVIVMGAPEDIGKGWKAVPAFDMATDESVLLLSKEGRLDGLKPEDRVAVQGKKSGNKINVEVLYVSVPGGTPAAEETSTEITVDVTIAGSPKAASVKLDGKPVKIRWIWGEGDKKYLLVAEEGAEAVKLFDALVEGKKFTIKGRYLQQDGKHLVFMTEVIAAGEAA